MAMIGRSRSLERMMRRVDSSRTLQVPADDDLGRDTPIDQGMTAAFQNKFVFEVAWEVANKVGGIYTVIRSKAGVTVDELGDQYCLLGPYNESCVRTEVEILEPEAGHIKAAIEDMKNAGVKVTYGRWLIDGYPRVILFDIGSSAWKLDEWKWELWSKSHIGIPYHDTEANDAVLFGALVAWFVGLFRSKLGDAGIDHPIIITHFHEWLAGMGLVFCKLRRIDCATIFTTHATLLGRYLCAGSVDFYNNLEKFSIDKEAGDRGIYHRYCMERAAVQLAHIFTTVSDITALESVHLLKRKPDVARLDASFHSLSLPLKLNLLLLALLALLWEVMALVTVLYWHSPAQKVSAWAIASVCWFVTYRGWYTKTLSPGLPGQGRLSYQTM